MATTCDKEAVRQAYDDVRNDKTETNWVVLKYDGVQITVDKTGVDYQEFLSCFTEEARLYGFLRLFTGDEMSKRAKFAFVTWIGSSVGALKRARVSTDKTLVKEVITNFAVEVATSDVSDLEEDNVRQLVIKAGGANYGTGSR